jgi:selenocysteine lyase/cysteine desulfurase
VPSRTSLKESQNLSVIHLDVHATTPVNPRVAEKVLHAMNLDFGNASSTYYAEGNRKFERHKFFRQLKELTRLKFDPVLWRQLTDADRVALQQMAQDALNLYYDHIESQVRLAL